jgi:hypothetical protein
MTLALRVLLLSAVTLACACGGEPTAPAELRQSFDGGEAGWRQFEALADKASTEFGQVWSVKALVFSARTKPVVWFAPAKYKLHWEAPTPSIPSAFPPATRSTPNSTATRSTRTPP